MILARLSLILALIAYGSSNSMSGTFQTCSLQCSNSNSGDHPVSDNNFQSHTLLRGKSGPRGEKGKVGHSGAKGVRGEKGDEGRKGVKGSQGEKGDIGPQGIKGEDGLSFNITEMKELQKKITESDATVRQLQTQISQLERESDVIIKKLRPQNCSQIKELNPESTTGRYAIYRHIFDIGKEVTCNMTDGGVEIASNCKEILDNDPTSSDGVYTININPSTIIDVYCDMSSGGVEVFRNCQEILSSDQTSSDGVYTISINPSTTITVYCDMSSGGVEIAGKNCKEILDNDPTSSDGVYRIQINPSTKINVYCEMNEGGWTVFQKRFDGSEDFRRNFNEYSEGFGDPSQEHWLGLNKIHQLTSQPGYNSWILRVDLESFEGETAYAQYEDFNVGAGTDYTLSIGSYSGTAGGSMARNNGRRFTTYDRDQDEWSGGSCADFSNGAWWFPACGQSNLNAHNYNDNRQYKGMIWYDWKSSYTMPMKSTTMKMKPLM